MMKKMRNKIRVFLSAAALGAICAVAAYGCEGFDDYQQQVNKLRVLGVSADSPDIMVKFIGSIPVFDPPLATLGAVIGDPLGDGREVSLYWAACPPMTMDMTGAFNCDGNNGMPISPDSPVFDPMAYINWLIARGGFDPEAFRNIDPGSDGGSIPILIWLRASAGSESVVSLKRINFILGNEPNHNPVLTGVNVAGNPLTPETVIRSGVSYPFTPLVDPDSIETYTDPVTGKQLREQPVVSWYSSEGLFNYLLTGEKSPSNTFKAPVLAEDESSRPVTFWFVLLDQRGGSDWIAAVEATITK
jgi:hypothetical protein